MKKLLLITSILAVATLPLVSCNESYSRGERVGYVTQFSETGWFFKTYEGHLNMTQTGMNSSAAWDFSLDRSKGSQSRIVEKLDSAVKYGYEVKLDYKQVAGLSNFMHLRGETKFFITSVTFLNRKRAGSQHTQVDTSVYALEIE